MRSVDAGDETLCVDDAAEDVRVRVREALDVGSDCLRTSVADVVDGSGENTLGRLAKLTWRGDWFILGVECAIRWWRRQCKLCLHTPLRRAHPPHMCDHVPASPGIQIWEMMIHE